MKTRLFLLIAMTFLPLAVAKADVIETLSAAPGTDLSLVYVGQQIVLQTTFSSTDAGEFFLNCCGLDVHIFWSSFDMQFLGGTLVTPLGGDLSTGSVVVDWTFLAVNPSTQEVFNGWPDCTGLPSNNSGCAVTNLGSYRPADSNHLIFDIQAAPEPGSVLLIGSGLAIFGTRIRRRLKG